MFLSADSTVASAGALKPNSLALRKVCQRVISMYIVSKLICGKNRQIELES